MLNFVLNEWDNDNSSLFKGYNRVKIENNNELDNLLSDCTDVKIKEKKSLLYKQEIQSHNAKYTNYLNTISLAKIYRDVDFYLPTFADFRGRIYPMTTYLNYQGNDLSRSLLLFSDTSEILDETGEEVLYAYLANLSGKSSES